MVDSLYVNSGKLEILLESPLQSQRGPQDGGEGSEAEAMLFPHFGSSEQSTLLVLVHTV